MSFVNILFLIIIVLGLFIYFAVINILSVSKYKKNEKVYDEIIRCLTPFVIIGIITGGATYYQLNSDFPLVYKTIAIIQNTIGAFFFNADLKIKDMIDELNESDVIKYTIGIYYSISIVVAPLLTIVKICAIIEKFISVRNITLFFDRFFNKKIRKVIIFGYNSTIEYWLNEESEKNKENKNEYIILTQEKIDDKTQSKFLTKNVVFVTYSFDSFDKQIAMIFSAIQYDARKDVIIVFENKNQSANCLIFRKLITLDKKVNISEDSKVFVYAENETEANRLQKFYDGITLDEVAVEKTKNEKMKEYKKEQLKKLNDIKKEQKIINATKVNVEIFNVKDYVITALLDKESNRECNHFEKEEYSNESLLCIHKLIIGFGDTGQKYLLHSMNTSVLTSSNNIIFDVFDKDIKNNRNEFINNFSRTSLVQVENVGVENSNAYEINNHCADGKLLIRFHEFDVKHSQVNDILDEFASEKAGGAYTSVFISLTNSELVNNAYEKVDRHLSKYYSKNKIKKPINVYIREYDGMDKCYFDVIKNNYVENKYFDVNNVSLNKVIDNKIINNAKLYSLIYDTVASIEDYNDIREKLVEYKNIIIERKKDEKENTEKDDTIAKLIEKVDSTWRELSYSKRQSSIALYLSRHIKAKYNANKKIGIDIDEKLKEIFKTKTNYEKENITEKIIKDKILIDYVKFEHRRWCYFMISNGWGQTDDGYERNDDIKKHDCLLNLEELLNSKRKDTIKFDLMPLFMEVLGEV